MTKDPELLNILGNERISSRQVDELIGLASGLCADGIINQAEVEFLQKWLAANASVSGQPILNVLYRRISEVLGDGVVDDEERIDLFDTLSSLAHRDFELGEVLKATTLPICDPAPVLEFDGQSYCFTGTFNFGGRKDCEAAIRERGGTAGSLTRQTDVLVIGVYATESWKHSAFGNKILKAAEMRDAGVPIAIVTENHWVSAL